MSSMRRQAKTAGGGEAAYGRGHASAPCLASGARFAPGAFNRRAASLSAAHDVDGQASAHEVSTASLKREAPV